MPSLRFRIVNVFTREQAALSGNPLCVFEDGAGLDHATMQALALQFNLSETTFLLPSTRADARVRIFTPRYEVAFAGHPTLGSAYVCRALGQDAATLQLETRAGVIPVRSSGARLTLEAQRPRQRAFDGALDELADALGLTPADLAGRPLWVSTGLEQLIVPLVSAVRHVRPRAEALLRFASESGHVMVYVFAQVAPERVLGRFFFSQGNGILEDPATGSATANLGGFLLASGGRPPWELEISQGEATGRPSTLYLQVTEDARVFVGGEVMELGSGTVFL